MMPVKLASKADLGLGRLEPTEHRTDLDLERSMSCVKQAFMLSETADVSRADTKFEDGDLKTIVAKEVPSPKRIQVG